jgi:hypothetical protein
MSNERKKIAIKHEDSEAISRQNEEISNESEPIKQRDEDLKAALAEGDRRFGNMLRHLAE